MVFESTNFDGERTVHDAVIRQALELIENAGSMVRNGKPRLSLHFRVTNELARILSNVCPPTEEILSQSRHVDVTRAEFEAAIAGLELPDCYYAGLRATYTAKRDVFLGHLRRTGLPFTEPQGAYYVLLDISSLGFATDTEAAEWFVREIGVAGVPGSSFFREPEHRFIRFHFAKKEDTLHAAGEKLAVLANHPRRG